MAAPIGQPRVRLPAQAKVGDIIDIRTLVSHSMETGQRRDQQGNLIPRDIIKRFVARFDGQEIFAMDLATAISANPYIAFPFKVEKAGTFEFVWINDANEERKATSELRVS
jgi:sulfur-oxidizing protein SoxZ